MAQLNQLNYNPDVVVDDRPNTFDPMPPGVYTAQVIESELTPTKAGTGQRLNLTFEIIEGHFSRRRVWVGLNIINANAQTQDIAQRELKRICVAVGHVGPLPDSDMLHFKPLRLRVGLDKDDLTKNVARDYSPIGASPGGQMQSQPAQAQAQSSEPQPQQQAASGAKRPWQK